MCLKFAPVMWVCTADVQVLQTVCQTKGECCYGSLLQADRNTDAANPNSVTKTLQADRQGLSMLSALHQYVLHLYSTTWCCLGADTLWSGDC